MADNQLLWLQQVHGLNLKDINLEMSCNKCMRQTCKWSEQLKPLTPPPHWVASLSASKRRLFCLEVVLYKFAITFTVILCYAHVMLLCRVSLCHATLCNVMLCYSFIHSENFV